MTIAFRIVINGLVLLAALGASTASGQEPKSPVAIVCAVVGTASVTVSAAGKTTPLRLFEWVADGSVIEVARGSQLTLVFSSGARYELGETAKATAGTTSLASSAGPVRELEAVPPFPTVLPITASARTGPRYGAVRIRGATLTHLYPHGDAATLADSAALRFAPVSDASRYSVEVETESGTSVLRVETQSPSVSISPGILKPGAKYYWQVGTLDRIGQAARGAAEFVTLSAEAASRRAALKQSLEAAGDAASLALLAEIDRSLGLLIEAREEFRAALAKAPGDVSLRSALERLEQDLAAEREKSER
jgi:hypothetical protein